MGSQQKMLESMVANIIATSTFIGHREEEEYTGFVWIRARPPQYDYSVLLVIGYNIRIEVTKDYERLGFSFVPQDNTDELLWIGWYDGPIRSVELSAFEVDYFLGILWAQLLFSTSQSRERK